MALQSHPTARSQPASSSPFQYFCYSFLFQCLHACWFPARWTKQHGNNIGLQEILYRCYLPTTGTFCWIRIWCQTGHLYFLTSRHSSNAQGWASEECPDAKNYKWRLNPVWHRMLYSCTDMATVGVKGLINTGYPYTMCWHCPLTSHQSTGCIIANCIIFSLTKHSNSGRLSICLKHSGIVSETVQHIAEILSPSGSPIVLSFSDVNVVT